MGSFRLEDHPKLLWEPTDDQHDAIEVLPSSKGFILADVTGLGKTYAALCSYSTLARYNPKAHLLVLSTKSSVSPWRDHLENGTNYDFQEFLSSTPEKDETRLIPHDVTVMTYTSVKKFPNYLARLLEQKYVVTAADEFHRAADPESGIGAITRYLRRYSRYFWGLTATPLGNHLESLYHLVDIVRPGYLGHTWYAFMKKYCHTDKVKRGPKMVTVVTGIKKPKLLREKLSRVMLRRDLNIKVDFHRVAVPPLPAEEKLYLVAAAGEMGGSLKQFSARLPDLQLVVNNAASCSKVDGERLYNDDYRTLASKETKLLELVQGITERPEPVVVFTSSLWTQKRIREVLHENLPSPPNLLIINGDTSAGDRHEISTGFGENDVLIMSPAGGESLNLQASGSLIFFDLPFDLKQFAQAAGRVVRMNTTYEKVDIYILESLGTIDSYKSLMVFANTEQFELVMKGTTTLPSARGKLPKGLLVKMRKILLWKLKELKKGGG